MNLEKEAKTFMEKRSREPKTLFEILKEINKRLEKYEDNLKEIKDMLRKVYWKESATEILFRKYIALSCL